MLRRPLDVAEELLGSVHLRRDLSWEHREASVLLIESTSRPLIVKQHRQPGKFAVEHHAYISWSSSLPEVMPELVTASPMDQLLILSVVPGCHPGPHAAAGTGLHQAAGRVLRRLHDVEPPQSIPDYRGESMARLEQWLPRAPEGLLDAGDVTFVRRLLDDLPRQQTAVPCHMDWQPRNWLVDDRGGFRVIDFEHGRFAPWYEDLLRLWANEWSGRPDLVAAFARGYGRTLTAEDLDAMRIRGALGDVVTIIWSREHGDVTFEARARAHLRQMQRK